MERLDAGFVDTVNPFNANQIKRVKLVPAGAGKVLSEGVDAFVFWTRNPRNILANAGELERRGFHFYVMVTITGYPAELEPGMLKTQNALAAVKELSKKIGPQRVVWRYDPVFFSNNTNEDFHRKNFNTLAQTLSGSVQRVIISVYNDYQKSGKRLRALDKAGIIQIIKKPCIPELFADMAKSAEKAGMEIQSCATKENYSSYGIKGGACIDGALINKLWGIELPSKDKNQRPRCLCSKSVDIGAYSLCTAHCMYCYAW